MFSTKRASFKVRTTYDGPTARGNVVAGGDPSGRGIAARSAPSTVRLQPATQAATYPTSQRVPFSAPAPTFVAPPTYHAAPRTVVARPPAPTHYVQPQPQSYGYAQSAWQPPRGYVQQTLSPSYTVSTPSVFTQNVYTTPNVVYAQALPTQPGPSAADLYNVVSGLGSALKAFGRGVAFVLRLPFVLLGACFDGLKRLFRYLMPPLGDL